MTNTRTSEELLKELIEAGFVPAPDPLLRWPSARVYVPLSTDVNTPPIPQGTIVGAYGQLERDTSRDRAESR